MLVVFIVIGALLKIFNDYRRISLAIHGFAGAKAIMVTQGEGNNYDQNIDILCEKYSMWGHIVGYIVAVGYLIYLGVRFF